MSKPLRLDTELVRRGLASSRSDARRAIEAGKVTIRGFPATRAAALVPEDAPIALAEEGRHYVSRGGEKLDGALERFEVEVAGRRWLDAGASAGGFTDRLLQGGAAAVLAVDVGYGQLDWKLRNNERVVVLERTNVRRLRADELPWRPDAVAADLSFISLTLVLPALADVAAAAADYVLLVKPQFEAGKDAVPRGGVVRSPELWRAAVEKVARRAFELGLGLAAVAPSRLPGPAGNREFFVHLRAGARDDLAPIQRAIEEVEASGSSTSRS